MSYHISVSANFKNGLRPTYHTQVYFFLLDINQLDIIWEENRESCAIKSKNYNKITENLSSETKC